VTLPGRFEVLGHHPLLVLDGAHNPDGAATLAATLEEDFAPAGRRRFVVGMLAGRDAIEMLRHFGIRPDDELVVCTPDSPRALPAEEVAAAAATLGLSARRIDSVGDALASALEAASADDAVIVAGSLYVVGAARQWCRRDGRLARTS
jgi:dihydrofolate synthase/folylpolyglutamate synthase